MNHVNNIQEQERILEARESYSGRLLTNSQFDEAMTITGIMEKEIHKSGTFKQKLGDYAHAFARTEKIDAIQGEEAIRNLFKVRYGLTMNQMREGIMQHEGKFLGRKDGSKQSTAPQLTESEKDHAHKTATEMGQMIKDGNKIAFHRAYSHQAEKLAQDFGITEVGAKRLMKEQFELAEKCDLYKWGKEIEEKYYRPQIKAEQDARESSPSINHHRTRART